MRKLLLVTAAVVAVSVSASVHAEPKRDILGFHPGMSYQEAMSAMAKICKGKMESEQKLLEIPRGWIPKTLEFQSFYVSCSLASRQVFDPAKSKPIMAPETLELYFAVNIPERPLIKVEYNFQTNAEGSDFAQSLFKQFGLPCDKSDQGMCFPAFKEGDDGVMAMILLDPPLPLSEQKPYGRAAWSDVAGLWLEARTSPAYHDGFLSLTDSRIAHADQVSPKF